MSDSCDDEPAETKADQMWQRDVATLRVLGIFFSIMGALVLTAIYQAFGNWPALVVTVASGLALVSVGAGMLAVSKRMSKQHSDHKP